jgi:hypothetical protein
MPFRNGFHWRDDETTMIFWINSGILPDPIPEFIQDALAKFFGLKYRQLQKLLAQHEIECIEFRKLKQFEWACFQESPGGGSIAIDLALDLGQVQKHVKSRFDFELRPDECALYVLFLSLGTTDMVAVKLGLKRPDPQDRDGWRKFRQNQIEAAARYAMENIKLLREYKDSMAS